MTVGENIKRIRKEKGLTQKELGERLKMTQSAIWQFENDKTSPRIETIEKIASALDVTPPDLMGHEYWDKKYPRVAQRSEELKGFFHYLDSLGYLVGDAYISSPISVSDFENLGNTFLISRNCDKTTIIPAGSHFVCIIKDGNRFYISEEEFETLQTDTKDLITLKLWQKSQRQKK